MANNMFDARKHKPHQHVWKPSSESANSPGEVDYYEPFMFMVSSALKLAKERLSDAKLFPNLKKGYAWDLSFFSYDRGVADRYGKTDARRWIKPDGVGMIGFDDIGDKHVHWSDIYCVYEAKSEGSSAIEQAGLYARQILSHQPNRTLVYALLHTFPNTVYFTRYDRAGCTRQKLGMNISKNPA